MRCHCVGPGLRLRSILPFGLTAGKFIGETGIPGGSPFIELVVAAICLVIPMLMRGMVGYVYGQVALNASQKNCKKRAWALTGVILNLIVLILPPMGLAVLLKRGLRH